MGVIQYTLGFSNNIKKYRQQQNLTQRDLAMMSNVSLRQIQALESGAVNVRHVKIDTVLRLSYALSIPINKLLGVHFTSDGPIYDSDFIWFKPDNSN